MKNKVNTSTLRVEDNNHIEDCTEETLKCTLMSAQMDAKILLREGKFQPKWTSILDDNGEHVLECALVPVYVGDDEQFEGLDFPFLVEIVESAFGDTFASDELEEISLRTYEAQTRLQECAFRGIEEIDGNIEFVACQI
tara:strand:- start:1252 stop:1668 length:417 start_codon:yes stop_codon:yes gene_type:complete